jgi:hypothetical protein
LKEEDYFALIKDTHIHTQRERETETERGKLCLPPKKTAIKKQKVVVKVQQQIYNLSLCVHVSR